MVIETKLSKSAQKALISFVNNPFLRILIPFIAGILFCTLQQLNINVFFPLLGLLCFLIIFYFLNRKKVTQFSKWAFIIISDAFLILSAFYCCYLSNAKNDSHHFSRFVTGEKQEWIGEVKDLPVEKEKFFKVLMEVKSMNGNEIANGKVLVYLKKPLEDSDLQPGNLLKLKNVFVSPKLPLNPHEFDYKEFLGRKNIYFQTFVEPQNFELAKVSTDFSLVNLGLKIKQKIINSLETSALNKETAQLCIALLTGYDDEINSETINAFAHSGTLHVLSVSGLHTGILYAVLVFILGLVDKNRKFKFIQLIIISVSLWFFALITGFSPPVLRAVIMLNLIAIGRSYYSYSSQNSVNILAVSAFLILIFDPLLIYDTGFLLSYMAVLGILYFEPGITALVNSRFTLVNKIWQLTSVSLAAQIATLPITLFLFHQFPFWFIFSNLIVIPLCTVVMFLTVLLLLKLNFITSLINLCSAIIFKCIHLTDERSFGYADMIDFGWSDFVFLTAFILVSAAFIKHRTYVFVAGAAVVMILWQLISLFESADKKSDSHLAIYHVNKQSMVDIKNSTQLHFDSSSSESNYNYHVKPNHAFYNYPDLNNVRFDYVRSANLSLFKLSSPNQQTLIPFLKPDYILVSENAGFAEEFFPKSAKLIIADGSNNYKHVKELKVLCDKFAIPFYSTAESGYLELDL